MQSTPQFAQKIISGGQTGADRAALDWAIENDLPHGGWCPRGRIAADGILGEKYLLVETESSGYRQRTRLNVVESDGTLIINIGPLEGGSLLTSRFARKYSKPSLLAQLDSQDFPALVDQIRFWLRSHQISVLNIAGPSEGRSPGIYAQTFAMLSALLGCFTAGCDRG